jgi:hypothetical protein
MSLPQGRKPISKKEIISMIPVNDQPQYVVVTTLQTFTHTYIMPVEACNTPDPTEGAKDEVTMETVREAGQRWLGEQILSADVVPLSKAIEIFDRESPYLESWPLDQKVRFINDWQERKDV